MKIYTLCAIDCGVEGIKSWKEMNSQVVEEIKDIIRKREIPEDGDEEDKEFVEENFYISDSESTAKKWAGARYLSEIVWTDDCDEFWIASSEL
jgi:hypothetical protein